MQSKGEVPKRLPMMITHLGPNDVLIGRGSPATANEGNIRFREVIRLLLPYYVATTRRSEKDSLARKVIDIIRSRQGRFVRRIESPEEADRLELDSIDSVWIVVEEEAVIPKVKQTFRDQHSESNENSARPNPQHHEPMRSSLQSYIASTSPVVSTSLFAWNPINTPTAYQVYLNMLSNPSVPFEQYPSMNGASTSPQSQGPQLPQYTHPSTTTQLHQGTESLGSEASNITEGLDILAQAAAHHQPAASTGEDTSTAQIYQQFSNSDGKR